MIQLNQIPVVKTEMLIRRPVDEVFEAFVNPEITTKFWFTKSSGRLETGKQIRWDWEMYGVWDYLTVKEMEQNRRILVEFSDQTVTEWTFESRTSNETLVSIETSGFAGTGDKIVENAIDSMGGYTMVLCALKALLEHNIILTVVKDKAPDANIK